MSLNLVGTPTEYAPAAVWTSYDLPKPSGVQAGDLIVIAVSVYIDSTWSPLASDLDAISGFAADQLNVYTYGDTSRFLRAVFTRRADGTEGSTFTVSRAGDMIGTAVCVVYRNTAGAMQLASVTDGTPQTSNDVNCVAPSVSGTDGYALICGFNFEDPADATVTPPSGMTSSITPSVENSATVRVYHQLLSSTGATGTRTLVVTTGQRNEGWSALVATIGVLTASGAQALTPSAALRAAGQLVATGSQALTSSALLTGTSADDMSATGAQALTSSAALRAVGRLTAAGASALSGYAPLTALPPKIKLRNRLEANFDGTLDYDWPLGDKPPAIEFAWDFQGFPSLTNLVVGTPLDHDLRQYASGTAAMTAVLSKIHVSGSSLFAISGDDLTSFGSSSGTEVFQVRATVGANVYDGPQWTGTYTSGPAADATAPTIPLAIAVSLNGSNQPVLVFDQSSDPHIAAGTTQGGVDEYAIERTGTGEIAQVAAPAANKNPAMVSMSVGTVGGGSASQSVNQFTVNTTGDSQIYGSTDKFKSAAFPVSGDFIVDVRVLTWSESHEWAKCGLMVRESSVTGSPMYVILVHSASQGNGLLAMYRSVLDTDAAFGATAAGLGAPIFLRLQRSGNLITSSHSSNGQNWTALDSRTVAIANSAFIVLPASGESLSGSGDTNVTAVFDKLAIRAVTARPSYTDTGAGSGVVSYTIKARDVANNTSAASVSVSIDTTGGAGADPLADHNYPIVSNQALGPGYIQSQATAEGISIATLYERYARFNVFFLGGTISYPYPGGYTGDNALAAHLKSVASGSSLRRSWRKPLMMSFYQDVIGMYYPTGQDATVAAYYFARTGPTGNGGSWTPNDWWLHTANGAYLDGTGWPGKRGVNHTRNVTVDGSGRRVSQYLADVYEPYFTEFAIIAVDNWNVAGLEPLADYDRNGVNESMSSATARQWYQEGQLDFVARWKANVSGLQSIGNTASSASVNNPYGPELYQNALDIAFQERLSYYAALPSEADGDVYFIDTILQNYRLAYQYCRADGWVMFNWQTNQTQYQGLRYGMGICAMDNGVFSHGGTALSNLVYWYNEYDICCGKISAAEPPQFAPRLLGCWARVFYDAISGKRRMWIVNPAYNGSRSINPSSIASGSWRFFGASDVPDSIQDPSVNTGANISGSITIPEQDARLLLEQ